jgi:tetratricopeptide (TPR) repeat protein
MTETIFISYSWSDTDLVDQIDQALQPTGLNIRRDIREIGYKDSIKAFMGEVRASDFVLLIVSDSFLKSANAMFEVLEVLKDANYKEKIVPIIVDDTKIYKPEQRLEYIKYWTEKHNDLQDQLKAVTPTDAIELYRELKHYENIKSSIDEFLDHLSKINTPKFSDLAKDNFQEIFNYLGVDNDDFVDEVLFLATITEVEERDIAIDTLELKYPSNSKVYFTKGHYAFEDGQTSKSSYFYEKSIELDPSFEASYFNLAYNREHFDKNYDEAKELYEKAVKLNPKNAKAYNNLAGLYSLRFNDLDEAKRLYDISASIDPFNPITHYNLGIIFQRDDKNTEKAQFHYEKAIQLDNSLVDAKHNYGMLLYEELNRDEDAKQQFLEILEVERDNKKTLQQLAELFEHNFKDYENAKIYWDRFIKIEPNVASDHHSYATFLVLHFRQSDKELARTHYMLSIEMDSALADAAMETLLA